MLPKIVKQLQGGLEIIVDGAIRTGADALKMPALGADAVMIAGLLRIAAMGAA